MDTIEVAFGVGTSLYDVLEVPSTASPTEIKKGYFRAALKYHPDKCPGDDAAKTKFQALSIAHSVLSDPERRRFYDENGEIDDEGQDINTEDDDTWYKYWRSLFPQVTVADIDSFSDKYKGSEEETRDVLEAYKRHKGNMNAVLDSVMLATDDDEERFRYLIEQAIEREDVASFPAFRKGKAGSGKSSQQNKAKAKRKSKADKEAAEAEKLMAMIKGRQGNRASGALSAQRSKQFSSMVSSLEARYGGDSTKAGAGAGAGASKRSKKSAPPEDLDDAEFERIQKRLEKGRKNR